MKAIYEFIVQIKESHNDKVTVAGMELKVDTRFNQGKYVNRIGTVIAAPTKYTSNIKEGFQVLIDKNLITYQVHDDNLINKSTFLIDAEKGYYRVPPDMVYLYRKDDTETWLCPSPYLFVAPIALDKTETESGLIYQKKNYKGNKEQYGTIVILNDYAKELGMKIGDTVYYKKDREYEFEIDGQLLYHMDNSDVLALVE